MAVNLILNLMCWPITTNASNTVNSSERKAKLCKQRQARWFYCRFTTSHDQSPDWLKKRFVSFHWLKDAAQVFCTKYRA